MSWSYGKIFVYTFKRAIGGGIAGGLLFVAQVSSLMALRTVIQHQFRYGLGAIETIQKLYAEGGLVRFYSGYPIALIQEPLLRFATTSMELSFRKFFHLHGMSKLVNALISSIAIALTQIALFPLDTVKNTLQVEGSAGIQLLTDKISHNGITALWQGAFESLFTTFLSHFPWFFTYNILNEKLPRAKADLSQLLRTAFIGSCASIATDSIVNAFVVVKTFRQTNVANLSIPSAVSELYRTGGLRAIFTRGLATRTLTNVIQAILFSVLWKYFIQQRRQTPAHNPTHEPRSPPQ
eukprot:TRINITY_DN2705_c0_g1_i1.p1 TRINITY_DN2705_c0_g1~~TRINITY_DN2705_c0_g1_i1.p1  ORF type:complete len:294 (+),score=18.07 TRINITY_DN2705_c0_g1_i1:152-1033(+)